MSGIYIPGMKMPTMCCECPLYSEYRVCCKVGVRTDITVEPKSKYCTLIPVPDHGRLADVDDIEHISIEWELGDIARIIAPTIIPADKDVAE